MHNFSQVSSRATRSWIAFLAATVLVCLAPNTLRAEDASADDVARLAMSTASLWMIEHHEHEISEAIEENNMAEAIEEAEELVPWIRGTMWAKGMEHHAHELAASVEKLAATLKGGDKAASMASLDEMKEKAHDLHHELMEKVGGGGHHH